MKPSDSSVRVKSFQDLKTLLEKKAVPLPPEASGETPEKKERSALHQEEPKTDRELFLDAMIDVTPIPRSTRLAGTSRYKSPVDREDDPDAAAREALEELVKHGKGFIVSQTSEYIEGKADRVHPIVLERLHRGDFSIQAHIDLHGLTAESAHQAFERFMKTSIMTGKHAVLIVHGRGLSSPVKPVLKTKVQQWLTSGPWRKWVIAFSSARHCDGGAGATYVLLRQRPQAKGSRKRKAAKYET